MKPQWQIEWERDRPSRVRRWWQLPCRHRDEAWSLWPGEITVTGFWPTRSECRKCGRVRHSSRVVHV